MKLFLKHYLIRKILGSSDFGVEDKIIKKQGYPLKPGHPKVSMGYEQQADEPFLAKEVRPFAQPTFQKGQEIGC